MKAAKATVAAISHGLTFGFHCSPVSTFAANSLLSWAKFYRYMMYLKTYRIHNIYSMYLKAYRM
jgi:hypothetical protein